MLRMVDAIAERRKDDPALSARVESLLSAATEAAQNEIVRRVYRYEDIGKHRTHLDGRARILEEEIQETFGLAMSDCSTCWPLAAELPLLAAAHRLSGREEFLPRILAQLEEMTTWSPLQRPGWTCFRPGNRLPEDGKDGNWLATGSGVRAIGDTLDLLPADAVPSEIRSGLEALLDKEIKSIVDDWEAKRPWFVRTDNAITNQWVLPTEGLIRACLVLGKDRYPEEYALGAGNLLKALDAHGDQGEFEEGVSYASATVNSMVCAARAMAAAGDRRAVEHSFLQNFPLWAAHHLQPAGMLINCFDCGLNRSEPLRSLFVTLSVMLEDAAARWAADFLGEPEDSLMELLYQGLPPAEVEAPPLFAAYERAPRVNWRSSWGDCATGVWIRGGHHLDQHDHCDRGHVNLIANGKPILIEAGTPVYHHPQIHSHFSTGYGHNVLQLGLEEPDQSNTIGDPPSGWQLKKSVAPLTVHRLDEDGGDVAVDGTQCHAGLERWHRRVVWDAGELTVSDSVKLSGETEDFILFRWHLGTEEEPEVSQTTAESMDLRWADACMKLRGSVPLLVSFEKLPDVTRKGRNQDGEEDMLHTCVVVRSREKVSELGLITVVKPIEDLTSS